VRLVSVSYVWLRSAPVRSAEYRDSLGSGVRVKKAISSGSARAARGSVSLKDRIRGWVEDVSTGSFDDG
jgi:hypothetical protein